MASGGISSYYKECVQCPRGCRADRISGRAGFCGEDMTLRAASAGLHFGEEPPVTVFGGSGTVFLTGCTLRCAFCQNYQISQDGMGSPLDSAEFTRICLALEEKGAENINLVTGSHHIPVLAQFIRDAKNSGVTVPFCWNSSAYETVEMLELLRGCVDIWLPDLKTLDPGLSAELFGASDYPSVAMAAVLWMAENFPAKTVTVTKDGGTAEKMLSGVIVRHLFLPGKFSGTADVLSWLKENVDGRAYISLMSQYTPVPFDESAEILERRKKSLSAIENRPVSRTEDGDLRDLIDAFEFETLFYQDLSDDDSWLPDFRSPHPFPNRLAVPVWHWKKAGGTRFLK